MGRELGTGNWGKKDLDHGWRHNNVERVVPAQEIE